MPGQEKSSPGEVAVPSALSDVVKKYTKEILRNKPNDVLAWSARYFESLANQESERGDRLNEEGRGKLPFEMPIDSALLNEEAPKLTLRGLKEINYEFRDLRYIDFDKLMKSWSSRGFSQLQLGELMATGEYFSGRVPRVSFVGIAACSMSSSVEEAVILAIEVLANGKEPSRIPFAEFEELYRFIASLDNGVSGAVVERALQHLSKVGNGFVSSDDIKNRSCPSLS